MKHWKKREAVAMAAITPASLWRGGRRWTVLTAAGTVLAAGLPTGAQATKYVWSGGTYVPGVTSPTPLLSSDVLSIETSADKLFANNFTNQSGEVDWLQGFITISNSTVTNNSVWRVLSSTTTNLGGNGTFVNNGIFRKEAGTGDVLIRGAFVNNGTIEADAGTINFKAGGVVFNDGTSFTGAGTIEMLSNAAFNGAISSTNLRLNGQTFTGSNVTLSGTAAYAAGDLVGDWTIANGSALSIIGTQDKFVSGNLINNGTLDWQQGFLQVDADNGTIVNNGVIDVAGGTGFNLTLTNDGIIHKYGTGDFNVRGGFINNGTLDAEAGTINYKGGVTFNSGTIFTGAGTNETVFDAKFNGAISSTNLLLHGGVATGTGVNLSGTARFASGTLAGDWTVANGSTLSIIGTQDKFVSGNLINNGTLDWQQGFLQLDGTGTGIVVNNGVIDVAGGTGFNLTLTNNGIVRNDGTGLFNVRGGLVNNGTMDAAGGTINYKGGVTFNNGTIFTGAFNNEMVFDAKFNGAINSINLLLNGGVQTGTAAVLSGTARFASGNLAGDWTIDNGSTLSVIGTQDKFISGNLINNGTLDWQQGFLQVDADNGTIVNNGVIDVAGGTGFNLTLTNDGIIHKYGTGDFNVRGGFINNGTLDAEAGTINYKDGVTFNSGTIFTGAGTNETVFDAKFNGAISSTNLLLDGGVATGTGVSLSGIARFASGTLAGDWTIANGSALSVIGTWDKFISGSFTNDGTVDWSEGNITLQNGGAVTNKGTMNILGDGDVTQGSGGGVFVNRGLVTKTGGGDTAFAAPVLNFGTIDVEAGSITLPSGATNFGTLEGTGTFALADTLTNTGTMAPGALGTGIGTLSLQGGYAQTSAGILDIQIGSGTLADLFLVSGQAQLDGSLALFCASCSVNTGDIFTILDSGGALTGAFASSTANGFNAGFAYTILYDTANTRVQVRIDNAGTAPAGVPEPASWAMVLFGFGAVGSALRRRPRAAVRIRFV